MMHMYMFVCFVILKEELVVYEAFNSPKFVEKLIQFLSLEEIKGQDQFSFHKFLLFKVSMYNCKSIITDMLHSMQLLFRNYGDSFLPLLLPHLRSLVNDSQVRVSINTIIHFFADTNHIKLEFFFK